MLAWNNYINELVSKHFELDDIVLKYCFEESHITPVVKASIQILERIIASKGKYNIIVFPEVQHLGFEFLIYKVIYNVFLGKIKMSYDPHNFIKGEHLQFIKCTVEFDCCKLDTDNIERIYFYVNDVKKDPRGVQTKSRHGLPITTAPFFQKTNAKRISTNSAYTKAYNSLQTNLPNILDNMKNNRTHLDGSIFWVGTVKRIKEYFNSSELNGTRISDIIYIGQTNGDGTITNIYSGQLKGTPAIVISSDLYSVVNAIENGAKIQSIIIDISQQNSIEKQLDALDDLHKYGFPMLCITDTKNSFNLDSLLGRNYNLWRWDKNSITKAIQYSNYKNVQTKLINCAKHNIEYVSLENMEISNSFELLYKNRHYIDDSSSTFISIYSQLFSISFFLLRNIIPYNLSEKRRYIEIVDKCKESLRLEKKYISMEQYEDVKTVIENLRTYLKSDSVNPKINKIEEIISSRKYYSICIVIQDTQNKNQCQKYWQDYCIRRHKSVKITIMYPQEYRSDPSLKYDLTIIVGWLNNKNMRNAIYSFDSANYIVLMFVCEDIWRKAHVRKWNNTLNQSCNKSVINYLLGVDAIDSSNKYPEKESEKNTNHNDIDFEEIENIDDLFARTKYRRYSIQTGNESVEVYPVSFVGGSVAFYKLGHKVITVTKIIQSESDEIEIITPDELQVGNFVVIRETERDIIRDLADKLLEKSGQCELRIIASKWKESLEIESLFASIDDIYNRLKKVGCSRGFQTVKDWITNDQKIIPKNKEDLMYIAQVTGDEVLEEKIDEVFDAGEIIHKIHIKAGRILSKRLRQIIVEKIKEVDDVELFNIWDPLTIQIEDIGTVKILKVIDKGEITYVDSGITNRLISE